jgi:hypothetical protein
VRRARETTPHGADACPAVEFATLTLTPAGETRLSIFKPQDIERLIRRNGLGKKEEGEGATSNVGASSGGAGDAMAVDA